MCGWGYALLGIALIKTKQKKIKKVIKIFLEAWAHPDLHSGFSPVTIGLYHPSMMGLKICTSLSDASGCGAGLGNTPPKTHSSWRNKVVLWYALVGALPFAFSDKINISI